MDVTTRREARESLTDLLDRADRGCGNAALLSGAPGMGKTYLIDLLNARAAERGATVLTATATSAEWDIPLAVVGQLLGADDLPRDPAAAVKAVHRRIVDQAADGLVVITVDDAQEIDAQSLRSLLYLMRRIRGSRILLVLAEGYELAGRGPGLVSEFARRPHQRTFRLAPLSGPGTGEFIAEALGEIPPGLDVAEWQHRSGGSPLLLAALLEDRAADPSPPVRPVAGRAHARAVRRLVSCLGPGVLPGVHGLAVLGVSETAPSWIDRLLGLPPGAATPMVRLIDAAGLTEFGRFRLPQTPAIVLQEMDPALRAQLHRRAAWLCFEGGAQAQAGTQLLAGGVVAEPWAERVICGAAEEALSRNDAAGAITYLRALQEVVADPRMRASIRSRLTHAEWELDAGSVLRNLEPLMEDHRAGLLDGPQCLDLVSYLLWHGRTEEADEVFGELDAIEETLPAESRNRLTSIRMWYAYAYPALGARYRDATAGRPPIGVPDARGVVDVQSEAALVLHGLLTDQPADGLLTAAERVLQQVVAHDPPVAPTIAALTAYVHHGRLDAAADWSEQLTDRVRRRSVRARAMFAAAFAAVESWRGRLDRAQLHAEWALATMSAVAWGVAIAVPLSALALAALARGEVAEAAQCFSVPVPPAMFQTMPGLFYVFVRGRYHLAVGRHQAALGDFYVCRDLMDKWEFADCVPVPWRLYAAETLIELGRTAEAEVLLLQELAVEQTDPARHAYAQRLVARLDAPVEPVRVKRLSRAEQRVVRLASEGCTNREIAARLSVTASTVEQHLTRSYQKLGVSSRTELSGLIAPLIAPAPGTG